MLVRLLLRYKYALAVFIFSRATLFLAVYLGLAIIPAIASGDNLWRVFPDNLFLDGFARWDSGWYLQLAESGYSSAPFGPKGQSNTAFFPAYPFILSLAGILGKKGIIAWGIAVSNASFAIGLCFLYDISSRFASKKTARLAVALAAFSPFSIFFSAVYTESFFFAATTASFWFSLRRSLLPSMIAAALAGVTRVVGVGTVPFAYLAFLQACGSNSCPVSGHSSRARLIRQFFAATIVGCSLLIIHLLYLRFSFGNFLQFAEAQKGWWTGESLISEIVYTWTPILNIIRVLRGEINVMGIINSFMAIFALGIMALGLYKKCLPNSILLWSFSVLLISSTVWFSAGRFATSLFSVYILIAIFFKRVPPEILIGCSALLMSLFAFVFSHWYWLA